ncbi:MAG: FAD-dependent oxidoreductase [Kofleriaceae bacterium]
METEIPDFPSLTKDEAAADVIVIGAGIAGLSVARTLAERGQSVLIIDRAMIGGGQTARTSAHLASALDDRFYVLRERFGIDGARLAAESHARALDIIEQSGIDCDFRRVPGLLFGDEEVLNKELVAAREAGLEVARIDSAGLPFDTGPALQFAGQGAFHPLKYLAGLARACTELGARIRTRGHVLMVQNGERPVVQLDNGIELETGAVVDATCFGITSRFDLPIRMAAYRSYCVGFKIPVGSIADALYWDTEDPYHYIRVADDMLIVGGADHRVGQGDPEDAWSSLVEWARPRFPMATDVVAQWSGQVGEPADGLAYIGSLPGKQNVYVVAGDSGNGLTHGVIAGELLPALIAGEPHPWKDLYSPARSRVHGLGTLLHEALKSNTPFRDWISPADVSSIDQIPPGSGATVRRGVHLVAAYRSEDGTICERSARCPHLHAVVRWNDAEKTWDCPAHGSRFDGCGRVLNGPSAHDLPDLGAGSQRALATGMAESTDVIDVLTAQHKQLDALFKKLEDAEAPDPTFTQLANLLVAHAAVEEKIFYPGVMTKETNDLLYESVEEHLVAKRLIADLVGGGLDGDTFKAKMSVLKEAISHHAHEEEEKKLFPKVRSMFDKEQREEMGQKLLALFEETMAQANVPVDITKAAPLPSATAR